MTTYPPTACKAPFPTGARGRFPRAGVRRRAGASIITVWLYPDQRMTFYTGKDHATLTNHADAVEVAQALAHFSRDVDEAARSLGRKIGARR